MTNKELKEYMDKISKKLDDLHTAFTKLQTQLQTKDEVIEKEREDERKSWNIKLVIVGLFLTALQLFLYFRSIR